MDDNIIFDLSQRELDYFKGVLKLINPTANVEILLNIFQRCSNFNMIERIKTLIWKPDRKVAYDVDYIDLTSPDRVPLLSPNYTLSFKNNYLKYIAGVNPKCLFDKTEFKKFYCKKIEECIFDSKILESYFVNDHFELIYSALVKWAELLNRTSESVKKDDKKPKNDFEKLNWYYTLNGVDMLFGIPISILNSKHFNDFLIMMWSTVEARKEV